MGFTDQELTWERYSGVAEARPYDDIRTFVPFDEVDGAAAALCIFSPIRDVRTGRAVSWASLDETGDRQAFIARVVRESLSIDQTWRNRLAAPTLGDIDPSCWAVLDQVLPHGPVKGFLFPGVSDTGLDLSWESLVTLMTVNGRIPPVFWWDAAGSFIVATPYDSVVTYVCGSVDLVEEIERFGAVETQRLI